MNMRRFSVLFVASLGLGAALPVWATDSIDWSTVPIIRQADYQAVNADGSSVYASSGSFPIRLVGVVLANTEDWLDPTANNFFAPYTFQMGGQAELIIQSVAAGDYGGTFCWMGQDYGNTYRADPAYSYSNTEWTAELGRLNLCGGDGVTLPIRAGDLVEIRVKAGLNYGGKMNVNEQHDNDRLDHDLSNAAPTDGTGAHDFEIVVLQRNYGVPTPTDLPLSLIKDANDVAIFDSTRATGGEHYQTTLVDLKNVKVVSGTWGADQTVTVQDASGRTLDMYLGLNSGFAATAAPNGYFNATGIVDQSSSTGKDGYRLLALDPSAIIRHGDVNKDHKVSIQDFNTVLKNFSGYSGTGKTWSDGNFNEAENGSIDIADFNATAANFTGNQLYGPTSGVWTSETASPSLAMSVASLSDGQVQLLVDIVTGKLTFSGINAQVNNWDIYSPSGSLVADADGLANPWSGYLINNSYEAAAYNGIGSHVTVNGSVPLDVAYKLGGSLDLQFMYADPSGNLVTGDVVVVPEPATMGLVMLAALGVLRRRRSSR